MLAELLLSRNPPGESSSSSPPSPASCQQSHMWGEAEEFCCPLLLRHTKNTPSEAAAATNKAPFSAPEPGRLPKCSAHLLGKAL